MMVITDEMSQWVKNLPATQQTQGTQVPPLSQEVPREQEIATPLVFLPENSHGLRSLAGYNPWGPKELDRTKTLSTMLWDAHHTLISIRCFFFFFSSFFIFDSKKKKNLTFFIGHQTSAC